MGSMVLTTSCLVAADQPPSDDDSNFNFNEPLNWRTFERPLTPPIVPGTSAPNSEPLLKKVLHPNVPVDFGCGANLLQAMEMGKHAEERKQNIFYPFVSHAEWELASWLSKGLLTQKSIDQFLRLEFVSRSCRKFNEGYKFNFEQDCCQSTVFYICTRSTKPDGISSSQTDVEEYGDQAQWV
jgi:hypothetical protein